MFNFPIQNFEHFAGTNADVSKWKLVKKMRGKNNVGTSLLNQVDPPSVPILKSSGVMWFCEGIYTVSVSYVKNSHVVQAKQNCFHKFQKFPTWINHWCQAPANKESCDRNAIPRERKWNFISHNYAGWRGLTKIFNHREDWKHMKLETIDANKWW